tara:strand:+ start:927 stop:1568 length:642 start_codon:yes stop_codon:yes gene_type:complete
MKINVISNDPYIYYIDNFLTDKECDFIIEKSKSNMGRAKTTFANKEEKNLVNNVDYKGRTNDSYWIPHNKYPELLQICMKIAKKINSNYRNFEQFQVIHYKENQEYKYHYDAWDKNDKVRYKKYCEKLGNRKITTLCYLNNVDEGGETGFDMIDDNPILIKPKKGRLIVFYNLNDDNSMNEKSRHAGLPVIKGEKWAFNLWLRDHNYINQETK